MDSAIRRRDIVHRGVDRFNLVVASLISPLERASLTWHGFLVRRASETLFSRVDPAAH